jgi:nitrogen fixation NifU-like protein
MNLPAEKQKSLILGLWRGDGYINLNRKGPRGGYATISYQLAQQIKILLLRQKIVPSIYEDKKRETNGVKHKKSYRIHVGQRDSLMKLCKIFNLKYIPKSYTSIDSWFDKNYLYTPITNREILNYDGKVHNLEVENSHSFVSEAFCLHNCGDIMYVYIKVGKKKTRGKEQEFIKDIKFKTLGCPAAIATSSMITELAKNKTLEQAMKITRDDVSKSLGRLPPIKEHCSNLAADALHMAIKDYRKKKK